MKLNPEDLKTLATMTAIAMYDQNPAPTLTPIGFRAEATGRVQLMRTGSGFWRSDHGAPFTIDKKLLSTIVRNTQMRARPLRGDYMHWSNMDRENIEDYRPSGYIDPMSLTIEPWRSPEGTKEAGIFAPVVWTPEAKALLDTGVNQISPVIDWSHRLRWDTRDAPAGTLIGPTITRWALCDEGFFWMDPARYYHSTGAPEGFLYSEVLMLTLEELEAMIVSLKDAGTDPAKILSMIKALLNGSEDVVAAPTDPGADASATPGMTASAPEGQGAPPVTMAARLYDMLRGAQPNRATPPARPASTPAAPSNFSLNDLSAAITGAVASAIAPIDQRLQGLEIAQSVALFSQAEASGLHGDLDSETAMMLFVNSPQAYQSFIAKRQPLVGSTPGAQVAGASPMTRAFNQASAAPVDDRTALANTAKAYQDNPANARGGRKPTWDQSLSYAIAERSSRSGRGQ